METIPRLHPDTIKDVEDRVDIVEVVSEQVVLKKKGKDYLGLCPFHDEKTPSFTVSPTKQMYYCFGCNAGGGAIKFLMEVGQQSFAQAVLSLANRYQVPVKTLAPEQRQELQRQLSLREQLYEILAVAASFYQHALRQPDGAEALDYVVQQRQLSEATIQEFGLGYAPANWESLHRYLVEVKRYSVLIVEQAGLIRKRKKGEGYYDYFRNRLMIPIWDAQGRVIGFGSRTLTGEEPKYLNSPETELFDKGNTLYALDRAKKTISKQDQAIVVEGYFDAIALHTAGFNQAVASLGTALSESQLKQLSRYTPSKQIVLNFDADTAGTKATQRAIKEVETLVYSGQIQLRVLNLPGGKDADEFLQSGADAVAQYQHQLDTAPLWLDWQIAQVLTDRDLGQADQFEQAAGQMVQLLNRIEDPKRRTYYTKVCAEHLSQGDAQLTRRYSEDLLGQLRSPKRKRFQQRVSSEQNLLAKAEELLLLIYIHCPHQRQTIIEELENRDLLFSLSHHRFLWQHILRLDPEGTDRDLVTKLEALSMDYSEEIKAVSNLLYLDGPRRQHIERSGLIVRAAIASLERVTCAKNRAYCLAQWQSLDPSTDPEQHAYYLNEFYQLHSKLQELDKQRSISLIDLVGQETV
ncbi:MAG: DNA primase [Spirulina sp. SIO3F2]|nr:DNA primase [Spirulina sp. SIO3F2]